MSYKSNNFSDWQKYPIHSLAWFVFCVLFIQFCEWISYLQKTDEDRVFSAILILSLIAGCFSFYFSTRGDQSKKFVFRSVDIIKARPDYYQHQLEAVRGVDTLYCGPILGKSETDSFYAAKKALGNFYGYHVHAQASMGEYIKYSDANPKKWKNAKGAINSKRCDLLITNRFGKPVLAIEHQGTGHDKGEDSAGRNAVKQLILQRAGIPMIETFPQQTADEIEEIIRTGLSFS